MEYIDHLLADFDFMYREDIFSEPTEPSTNKKQTRQLKHNILCLNLCIIIRYSIY